MPKNFPSDACQRCGGRGYTIAADTVWPGDDINATCRACCGTGDDLGFDGQGIA